MIVKSVRFSVLFFGMCLSMLASTSNAEMPKAKAAREVLEKIDMQGRDAERVIEDLMVRIQRNARERAPYRDEQEFRELNHHEYEQWSQLRERTMTDGLSLIYKNKTIRVSDTKRRTVATVRITKQDPVSGTLTWQCRGGSWDHDFKKAAMGQKVPALSYLFQQSCKRGLFRDVDLLPKETFRYNDRDIFK